MRSLFANLISLTLPAGGGVANPRIVLGPQIPPELLAFGLVKGVTFYVGEVYYLDATTYMWVFLTDFLGLKNLMQGTYDPVNGVYVTDRRLITGAGIETRIGSNALNSATMTFEFQQANVQMGTGGALYVGGRISATNKTYSAASAAGSRNSNVFADTPGSPSVTILKLGNSTDTDLIYQYTQTCFSPAIGGDVEFGANPGSGTVTGGRLVFNIANTHLQSAGMGRLTGLAAGSKTVNLRWRAVAGTVQMDVSDFTTMHVWEAAA